MIAGRPCAGDYHGAMGTADPKPMPPEKPLPTDCCGDGCAMCVNDVYEQQLEDYEAALAAWRARNEPPA